MGVPALFRWLSQKYPKICSRVIEEQPMQDDNNNSIPIDWSLPNPNEVEFDNLYLDMNGIIHPCCHPEDKPAPETEEQMIADIFDYIDRILSFIRPRKLLYMAIDGVAPRAKMNQQRSRRFRAAQEAEQKRLEEEEIAGANGNVEESKPKAAHFDSNCITPGSPFMYKLAQSLRYYISERYQSCPGWKNLKVILSDASTPGEGEHKVMDFIRSQRRDPKYDPNTKHVMYGLDADLIMLAIATHEPHFRVLREDVFWKPEYHQVSFDAGGNSSEPVAQKPYIFLHVDVLREYLEAELKTEEISFPFSLERALDDWVFLCFFVGNDFLPHLPSLEIREGAIDRLIDIYKANLKHMGGYMTKSGDVNLKRVEILLRELGEQEDMIFQKRKDDEDRREQNRKRREQRNKRYSQTRDGNSPNAVYGESQKYTDKMSFAPESIAMPLKGLDKSVSANTNKELLKQHLMNRGNHNAALTLKAALLSSDSTENAEQTTLSGDAEIKENGNTEMEENKVLDTVDGELNEEISTPEVIDAQISGKKRKEPDLDSVTSQTPSEPTPVSVPVEDDDSIEVNDEVRLWEDGYKSRYYRSKFGVELSDQEFRKDLVKSYIEGFCWVLKYYFQGVPSWKWYYPYHYSPFASDFVDIGDLKITFELSEPFRPIEQLMGVLPAASNKHIPEPFRCLMEDPESPIIDFYPTDFKIDLNGKKHAWQGVALLPFIDAQRLLDAMAPIYPQLSPEDVELNKLSNETLFVGNKHKLFEPFCGLYGKGKLDRPVKIGGAISGYISLDEQVTIPGCTLYSPFQELSQFQDLEGTCSISIMYSIADTQSKEKIPPFESQLLPGVKLNPRILSFSDIDKVKNPNQYGDRVDGYGNRNRGGSYRGNYRGNYNHRGGDSQGGGYGYSGRGYGRDQYFSRGSPNDRNSYGNSYRGDSRQHYPNSNRNSPPNANSSGYGQYSSYNRGYTPNPNYQSRGGRRGDYNRGGYYGNRDYQGDYQNRR